MNAERALKDAFKVKNRGFPKFSKFAKQSFTWNNQGFSIKDFNERFKIFNLMKMPLKMRHHRDLPPNAKIKQIVVSCSHQKYFVSFSVEYEKDISIVKEPKNSVGIDLNIYDIALSNKELIKTYSKIYSQAKYSKLFKRLQRKQSRRVLKSKQNKIKLGGNFYKTQKKLNKAFDKSSHQKLDRYHKITSELSKQFELIVVEDLQIKNMTKRAKLKNVKQKSGLNKSILNTTLLSNHLFFRLQALS